MPCRIEEVFIASTLLGPLRLFKLYGKALINFAIAVLLHGAPAVMGLEDVHCNRLNEVETLNKDFGQRLDERAAYAVCHFPAYLLGLHAGSTKSNQKVGLDLSV
jgi:hypothetical protein